MIKYSLICAEKHRFDSWFASAGAFESLQGAGMINCAICGSPKVEKAIMAPTVQSGAPAPKADVVTRPLSTPATPAEAALAELRKKVEAESDYVGGDFASEARAINDGESPQRSIHGEANPQEARKLIEDGIPVMPLPFMAGRKTN